MLWSSHLCLIFGKEQWKLINTFHKSFEDTREHKSKGKQVRNRDRQPPAGVGVGEWGWWELAKMAFRFQLLRVSVAGAHLHGKYSSLIADIKHCGSALECLPEAPELRLVSQLRELFGGSGS